MLSLAAVWTSVFFIPEFRNVLVPSRRSETPGVKRAVPSPRTGAVTPRPARRNAFVPLTPVWAVRVSKAL